MNIIRGLLTISLLFFMMLISGQVLDRKISWDKVNSKYGESKENLSFENAEFIDTTFIPYYTEMIEIQDLFGSENISVINRKYEQVKDEDLVGQLKQFNKISDEIQYKVTIASANKKTYIRLLLLPLRITSEGEIEKLVEFSIRPDLLKSTTSTSSTEQEYSENSVLNSGNWVKIKITRDGIYKLSYEDILGMGLSDPSNVRIFGNGGQMLSFLNSDPGPDDLIENAIYMNMGGNGIFDQGDYVLFYGKGPVSWNYDESTDIFTHSLHLYSNAAYYFVTTNNIGSGKKIGTVNSEVSAPDVIIDTYDDYAYKERELYNLIGSGRHWYGEKLYETGFYDTTFVFPDLYTSSPVKILTRVAGRAGSTRNFTVRLNNASIDNFTVSGVNMNSSYDRYAKEGTSTASGSSNSSNLNVRINYDKLTTADRAWLDYITVNCKRNLRYNGQPLLFRAVESVGIDNVTRFNVSNANSNLIIWNVTDIHNIKQVNGDLAGSTCSFSLNTDSLLQFAAFDLNSAFLVPEIVESIDNQDLHGVGPHNLLIITHSDFLAEAEQLAQLHRDQDNISVYVTTPDKIYNEFSSGSPDISAIRDFIRMIYSRSTGTDDDLKYLLLFGDGSYNNFSNNESNPNFILTYQSEESLMPTSSYVTDDFFGHLDEEEGGSDELMKTGLLDIGIGRIPVKTQAEAQGVLNKIIAYYSADTYQDWRNYLCFVGDDGEHNNGIIHMSHANSIANTVETNYPEFTVDKILFDAYNQVTNSTGSFYPDVEKAILENMNKGMLIFNYSGHGGEYALAQELIVQKEDIVKWNNFGKFPLFITATCQFSRYDNVVMNSPADIKETTSAGELVLLNPNGGGIGLISTTRLVYSSSNFTLNSNIFQYIFERDEDGKRYRLGDIIRLGKNATYDLNGNKMNFSLFADPAITLAYPEYKVITDSVNHVSVENSADTLKAFDLVLVSGHVTDNDSILMSDFNGFVYPKVFDKPLNITTQGNDGITPYNFDLQMNVLYKGKATVENGYFNYSFKVPKDITYSYGKGKITYYAENSVVDANGYYNDFIIGGTNEDAETDFSGPVLNIYMNDTLFRDKGVTDNNPVLYADVFDENGINMAGNGIGHDIIGILDHDYTDQVVLNDYFNADLDDYKNGTVIYQLNDLEEGEHSITVRLWDTYNNSTEETLEFIVVSSDEFTIFNLSNYPNPFSDYTYIQYEHNMPDEIQNIIVRIYDMSGRLITSLKSGNSATGYKSEPIIWDGRNYRGEKVAQGMYICKVIVENSQGIQAEKNGKLLLMY